MRERGICKSCLCQQLRGATGFGSGATIQMWLVGLKSVGLHGEEKSAVVAFASCGWTWDSLVGCGNKKGASPSEPAPRVYHFLHAFYFRLALASRASRTCRACSLLCFSTICSVLIRFAVLFLWWSAATSL